jgi:putative transcriptional regulator
VREITSIPIKNNIQKYREVKDINQEELAKELGVTRSYLSKLENQKFSPGPGLMLRICSYFGAELGEMFYIGERGKLGDGNKDFGLTGYRV